MDYMIKERRQDIREHFKDSYDENAHKDPFANLFRQRCLHDLPETKADDGNDDRDDDGGPKHEAFAENKFVHILLGLRSQYWEIILNRNKGHFAAEYP
jgi:hypothetical protein